MSVAENSRDSMLVGNEGALKRFLRATEIDSRVVGMVIALMFIWIGFHLAGP